jgi:hypothetical protein
MAPAATIAIPTTNTERNLFRMLVAIQFMLLPASSWSDLIRKIGPPNAARGSDVVSARACKRS